MREQFRGDLHTALSWGITYDLDKSQVPRSEMKRYEVEREWKKIESRYVQGRND